MACCGCVAPEPPIAQRGRSHAALDWDARYVGKVFVDYLTLWRAARLEEPVPAGFTLSECKAEFAATRAAEPKDASGAPGATAAELTEHAREADTPYRASWAEIWQALAPLDAASTSKRIATLLDDLDREDRLYGTPTRPRFCYGGRPLSDATRIRLAHLPGRHYFLPAPQERLGDTLSAMMQPSPWITVAAAATPMAPRELRELALSFAHYYDRVQLAPAEDAPLYLQLEAAHTGLRVPLSAARALRKYPSRSRAPSGSTQAAWTFQESLATYLLNQQVRWFAWLDLSPARRATVRCWLAADPNATPVPAARAPSLSAAMLAGGGRGVWAVKPATQRKLLEVLALRGQRLRAVKALLSALVLLTETEQEPQLRYAAAGTELDLTSQALHICDGFR